MTHRIPRAQLDVDRASGLIARFLGLEGTKDAGEEGEEGEGRNPFGPGRYSLYHGSVAVFPVVGRIRVVLEQLVPPQDEGEEAPAKCRKIHRGCLSTRKALCGW